MDTKTTLSSANRLSLPVEGMTCASCGTINKTGALTSLKSVQIPFWHKLFA
ncbi:heavy-metal-associated domain-containing protein [Proteus vulgaris]|jgi:hypothetical protein|uniref:heavy-metal-associated domain-containing protein n=1 Tax=Proteus TaxID=583 RepID=UPI00137718CE|nr:heavy metal-associated domain-containing protein [Proteus sp. G2626]MBG5986510.1 heavy-metal-associated domain-containing protein [Proteus vulgaris]MCH4255703.1 heavy-metal-associated domain-containing protein [Proteus vulgaris]NBN58437.1 hypothetical protein [Proteus sp. G2639]